MEIIMGLAEALELYQPREFPAEDQKWGEINEPFEDYEVIIMQTIGQPDYKIVVPKISPEFIGSRWNANPWAPKHLNCRCSE
jgi:hypothetical protein